MLISVRRKTFLFIILLLFQMISTQNATSQDITTDSNLKLNVVNEDIYYYAPRISGAQLQIAV